MRATALGLLLSLAPSLWAQHPPYIYDADRLPADFHRDRRERILERIGAEGLAVFFSNPVRNRSNDVDYSPYKPDNNLYYLTGLDEPEAVLVLSGTPLEVAGRRTREVAFVRPRDPEREIWTGRRLGPELAERLLGLERALPTTRFPGWIDSLLRRFSGTVYLLPPPEGVAQGSELARQLEAVYRALGYRPPGPQERRLRALLAGADTPERFERARAILRSASWTVSDTTLNRLAARLQAAARFEDWNALRARWLERSDGRPRVDDASLGRWMAELRQVKTEAELRLLRRAIAITVEAHRELMRQARPGMHEYELQAIAEYVFKRRGAQAPGFPSIVGSGENTVILHYETNRRQSRPGDLVLVDIGAEYHGYTADVTRTFPISGRFSPEQRAIYEVVLAAQEAVFRAVKPGATLAELNAIARREIARGLMRLGLIGSEAEVGRYFMHGVAHHIGLDVHDVSTGSPLEPGMVIAVEPGVYIAEGSPCEPKWWNIGVRIEDDLLITPQGYALLSEGAPRTVAEIEALMRRGRQER
ncbi:MAG: aminopeptidase P N-terminal domain-containing protein [Bacteroidetes bacterium]|nr:aminopeptidase P N-terminal domain-containing protein [Bacteroidota bacterium]